MLKELFLHNQLLLALFVALVGGMLVFDLGVLNKKAHTTNMKQAVIWTVAWIALALSFGGAIYVLHGPEDGVLYFTAYLIEKSLSVDNIFVFIVIFLYFDVPPSYQHRVLFWGILGALVMRGALIILGIELIDRWHWLLYLLGAFLIFTGLKAAFAKDRQMDVSKNPVLRLIKRFVPVTAGYEGAKFLAKDKGRLAITPLFVVLIVIEATDLVFALDSIPAILAISTDPFIVYTSNIFAILGLRAMYFVVADFMRIFKYLRLGVCSILVLVGIKMVVSGIIHIPPKLTLVTIISILTLSMLASLKDLKTRDSAV